MVQNILINQYDNPLQEEFIKLFARSGLPLHFNKTGYKDFTNFQRVSIIILFRRSGKSLRDFVVGMSESKWISWLGFIRIPSKSTLHNWIKLFEFKTIKQLFNFLKPKSPSITAIDGTGFDSFHRSRHYEKRVGFDKMPYAKADLFVDTATKKIIDFSLVNKHQHDIVAAKQFCQRNNLEGITILCDGAYDCEELHRQIHDAGGKLFAPVRKMNKRSLKKFPKGWFRKKCLKLPDFFGKRSIIEAVNASLKKRFLNCLRSKTDHMKKREFAWTMVVYNLTKNTENPSSTIQTELQTFFILIWVFIDSGQSLILQ
ncbi:MAG: transposase [Nanoarchaeota archaeon]|nr:transposase [Nanoarchaeota archaeon]